MKRIYLDNAAATKLDKQVKKEMEKVSEEFYGNPSAKHREGRMAREFIEQKRKSVSQILNSKEEEIFFNSSGTESNNSAIFGVISALNKKGRSFEDMHVITTPFEHFSVYGWLDYFESKGVKVDYLNVNKDGAVETSELKELLNEKTILVSIMYVNNEIGTVQPVSECAEAIINFKKKKEGVKTLPYFHIDAAHAPLYFDCDVEKAKAQLISLDGHKIYGPKGVGILYKEKNVLFDPLIKGGGQEFGLRAGTENVPLIAGITKALELSNERKEKDKKYVKGLSDYFLELVFKEIKYVSLNGAKDLKTPHIVNISFPGFDNNFLVINMDNRGIACSTGAACKNLFENLGSLGSVSAIGKSSSCQSSSLRFAFSRDTNKRDIKKTIKVLKEVVEKK